MEMARRGQRVAGQAARGVSSAVFTVAGVALIGIGVPLFWVWAASQLAGDDRHLTSALAVFTATGILTTYCVLLVVGGSLRARFLGEQEEVTRMRRASWNRSMRDEPLKYGEEKMDPVERIFILTAVLGFIAFEVWFLFFAGSPLAGFPQA